MKLIGHKKKIIMDTISIAHFHSSSNDEWKPVWSIQFFFGDDPQQAPDYGRIINERRFDKLESYLLQGKVITGGKADRNELYFAPTILEDVNTEAPVMKEEIIRAYTSGVHF